MQRENFDLHMHSNVSDGIHPPAELAPLAALGGCEAFALTDHDTTEGLAAAGAAARAAGVRFIPGVEISVTWPQGEFPADDPRIDIAPVTVHVVGLGIDPANPVLQAGLAGIREGRQARAERMADALGQAGIPGILPEAMGFAKNPGMIGRTHFARALVARGVADSVGRVFERFLTRGNPGYAPHRWATLQQAVDWIRAAGGIAVVAHPGRYKLAKDDMKRLLADFKAAGGAAVEVITGSHQPYQYDRFAQLARELGLMASRGSDYHGPGESKFAPGTLPPLPDDLDPVWRALPAG